MGFWLWNNILIESTSYCFMGGRRRVAKKNINKINFKIKSILCYFFWGCFIFDNQRKYLFIEVNNENREMIFFFSFCKNFFFLKSYQKSRWFILDYKINKNCSSYLLLFLFFSFLEFIQTFFISILMPKLANYLTLFWV